MTRYQYPLRVERVEEDSQPGSEPRCTCTGGPYVHGPEGLRLALQQTAAASPPEQQTEGDTADE